MLSLCIRTMSCLWGVWVVSISNPVHAVLYTGSMTSGFGGAVGGSTMDWTDDGTTVTVDFTKGLGTFEDVFVLYLDTGIGGRSSIGPELNDRVSRDRASVSYLHEDTGHSLTFPTGFEASYAISINSSLSDGLFSIPETGDVDDSGLGYIDTVGKPSSIFDSSFTFSFDLAEIGLTSHVPAEIKFVATYVTPYEGPNGLGFVTNEGYGSVFPASNIGQNGFAFSDAPLSYIVAVPEPSAFLFGGLICGFLVVKKLRKGSVKLASEVTQ